MYKYICQTLVTLPLWHTPSRPQHNATRVPNKYTRPSLTSPQVSRHLVLQINEMKFNHITSWHALLYTIATVAWLIACNHTIKASLNKLIWNVHWTFHQELFSLTLQTVNYGTTHHVDKLVSTHARPIRFANTLLDRFHDRLSERIINRFANRLLDRLANRLFEQLCKRFI